MEYQQITSVKNKNARHIRQRYWIF